MDKGNCRSCGAPLLWVRSATTQSLMPLDAEPTESGNICIVDGLAVVRRGDLFESSIEGPRYVSHFSTCKDAAKFRKPRAAK